MYYYVFEAVKNNQTKRSYEKIKHLLSEYGISGEVAVSSPARTAEELTQLGVEKAYSTIVAVGSDSHINRVASIIKSQRPSDKSKETVLGMVPIDKNSSISEKFGLVSFKIACETLKFRKVEDFDIAYIEPNRYFLTTAEIHTASPVNLELMVDHCQIKTQATDLVVFSNMTLTFFSQAKGGVFKKIFSAFSKPIDSTGISIFKARVIQLNAPPNLPLIIEGEIAARTPTMIYRRPRALKIIVKRDRVVTETD